MKRIIILVCSLILVKAFAHTLQEELEVANLLVRYIMCSPEWEDNITTASQGAQRTILPVYSSYEDLFTVSFPTNHIGSTWSPQERRNAFEDFVAEIPTLSTNGLYRAIEAHAGIALNYCVEHNASNVLQSALHIMSSTQSVARISALSAFREFAYPSERINDYASEMLLHGETGDCYFRSYLLCAYVDVLRRHRNECLASSFSNGVSIVKSFVSGADGAIAADMLLQESYSSYCYSSNRLALALEALGGRHQDGPWSEMAIVRYFTPITNQLLNASQPLVQLELP